jgi:hypothetical protein
MEASFKADKYKDVITESFKHMVKEKSAEVNVFCIMSNHIHLTSLPARQVWQIQDGYERDAIQINFLKFISQTIKRDLGKKHFLINCNFIDKYYKCQKKN